MFEPLLKADYFEKPKILNFFQQDASAKNIINPLFENQESFLYHEELNKMTNNISLYYAPRKIFDIDTSSTKELTEHLTSIFGDTDFAEAFSKLLKKDTDCPTPKEARNWIKKYKKKCIELRKK